MKIKCNMCSYLIFDQNGKREIVMTVQYLNENFGLDYSIVFPNLEEYVCG